VSSMQMLFLADLELQWLYTYQAVQMVPSIDLLCFSEMTSVAILSVIVLMMFPGLAIELQKRDL